MRLVVRVERGTAVHGVVIEYYARPQQVGVLKADCATEVAF